MKIILNGNPMSTNGIYRTHGHIVYMTKEGKALKTQYQWEAKSQWKGNPTDKSVEIDIKLYFKNKRRHDIDNYCKILLDSLTEIVWDDDSQIKKMVIKKFISKTKPRIEVGIRIIN